MSYMAPSKEFGEWLGMPLHCSWGFRNHAELEEMLGGLKEDRWSWDLARLVVSRGPSWMRDLGGRPLFHAALGMISQFCEADIRYFIDYPTEGRPPSCVERLRRIHTRVPPHSLQWIPSPSTMDVIEGALRLRIGVVS